MSLSPAHTVWPFHCNIKDLTKHSNMFTGLLYNHKTRDQLISDCVFCWWSTPKQLIWIIVLTGGPRQWTVTTETSSAVQKKGLPSVTTWFSHLFNDSRCIERSQYCGDVWIHQHTRPHDCWYSSLVLNTHSDHQWWCQLSSVPDKWVGHWVIADPINLLFGCTDSASNWCRHYLQWAGHWRTLSLSKHPQCR